MRQDPVYVVDAELLEGWPGSIVGLSRAVDEKVVHETEPAQRGMDLGTDSSFALVRDVLKHARQQCFIID